MAKKKRKKPVLQPEQAAVITAPTAPAKVPEFEIGKKGDEFDLKYTRAAAASKFRADSLLRGLSKETRVAGYNLINFAVLALMVIVLAMSFAFLSRSGEAPQMRIKSLLDGSYTARLTDYYRDELPFGRELKSAWAFLGFREKPEGLPDEPLDPDAPIDGPNSPDEPSVTTEPIVTTAPPTTEPPTSAPIAEPSETTRPDTKIMYARDTVNIRLSPSTDSMIMGYFEINEEVEVIELRPDGWAEILYNDIIAYISSDYLGEETVATTRAPRRTTTQTTTEEITTVPEETEPETVTTVPEETEPETTTTTVSTIDYESYSRYIEQSVLESMRQESEAQATATQPTEPQPTQPQPTEPQPPEPPITEPQPTEPQPTEPQPSEPQPTEPAGDSD